MGRENTPQEGRFQSEIIEELDRRHEKRASKKSKQSESDEAAIPNVSDDTAEQL